jgi:hypothetical protein
MTKARDLANAASALSAVSATELGYVDGVTSAIQTQLDAKLASATAATTYQAINANVSTTELGYLDGVTSAIQTQLDAKTAKSTLTTTGDIYYASSANTPARLGIGSSAQVLTVASGVPSWATPASGGGITLITDVQLSASSGYDFSSIPSTYKNLVLTFSGLQTTAIATNFGLRFNSNSSAIYDNFLQYQETGSSPSISTSADTVVSDSIFGNQITSATSNATARGSITLYDYASTTRTKVYSATFAHYSNNNARVNFYSLVGNFNTTTAITSLNIVRFTGSATISNQSNTSIRLYGVS